MLLPDGHVWYDIPAIAAHWRLQGLGLDTLAEGLETQGQLAVLEALGCDAYQGCWVSYPLEAEAFEAVLRTPAQA